MRPAQPLSDKKQFSYCFPKVREFCPREKPTTHQDGRRRAQEAKLLESLISKYNDVSGRQYVLKCENDIETLNIVKLMNIPKLVNIQK